MKDYHHDTFSEVYLISEDCDINVETTLNNSAFINLLKEKHHLISIAMEFKECLFTIRHFLLVKHYCRSCIDFELVSNRVYDLMNDYACKLEMYIEKD